MFIFFRSNLLPDNHFRMNLFPNPLEKNAWYVLIGQCAIMHFMSSLLNLMLMYSFQANEKDCAQEVTTLEPELINRYSLALIYQRKEGNSVLFTF